MKPEEKKITYQAENDLQPEKKEKKKVTTLAQKENPHITQKITMQVHLPGLDKAKKRIEQEINCIT